MKKTKTVKLELYPEKEQDFYKSLLRLKYMESTEMEDYKKLVDAIHFDKGILNEIIKPDRHQQKKVNVKTRSIFTYLFSSVKDSKDYLKISKATFTKFKRSEFGKELIGLVASMELYRKHIGEQDSPELKATVITLSECLHLLTNAVAEGIGQSLSDSMNLVQNIQQAQNLPLKVKVTKKGGLLYAIGEEQFEMELFLEKDGQIRKTIVATDLSNMEDDGNIHSILLKINDFVVQFIPGLESSEIVYYEGIKEKGKKLILSPEKEVQRISITNEGLIKEVYQTEDGSFEIKPIQNAPASSDEIAPGFKIESNNKISFSPRLTDQNGIPENPEVSSFLLKLFEEQLGMLKPDQSKRESIDKRDKVIIGIYQLITNNYSDVSFHVRCSATGFIAAELGWLDSQDVHSDMKRRQRYRKYLIDTVTKIIKKSFP
jgi:hypothetical protein